MKKNALRSGVSLARRDFIKASTVAALVGTVGSGFRAPAIEGYCSRQSVLAGETLDIMVSTAPAAKFSIEIFRTGYYGGRGARLMTVLGPLNGKKQPEPEIGPRRLRECKWQPSASIKIPSDWPSGVYLGRLTTIPGAAEKLRPHRRLDYESPVRFAAEICRCPALVGLRLRSAGHRQGKQ